MTPGGLCVQVFPKCSMNAYHEIRHCYFRKTITFSQYVQGEIVKVFIAIS